MSLSVVELLQQALESFERYEYENSLQRLLEAWREARAERLAWLAERLTALVNTLYWIPGPFRGPSVFELVLARMNTDDSPRRMGLHLKSYLQWPVDPRHTSAMLDLAAHPKAHEEPVFLPLCELFLKHGDPRALEPLRALHAGLPPGGPYAQRLGSTLERFPRWSAPPLGAEALAMGDALEEAFARREEGEARSAPLREELLARVAAHPEDDTARLVLADHLLAQGNPLGELIMLQCGPQPDEARVARLLQLHGTQWAGQLGRGVSTRHVRFERGFPVAVSLYGFHTRLSSPPNLFWCGVRELDCCWSPGVEQDTDWFAHPHLRGVKVLKHVPIPVAARLGTHPLPVRRLVTGRREGLMGREDSSRTRELFTALASLPHLTWLEFLDAEPEHVRQCAASPLARRLERFVASNRHSWALVVAPAAEVPVEVTLNGGRQVNCEGLAQAIGAAAGFSTRALRIQSEFRLDADQWAFLRRSASAYARVEWDISQD